MIRLKILMVKVLVAIATGIGAMALYRRIRYGSWRELPRTVHPYQSIRPPRPTPRDLTPVVEHWEHTLWEVPGLILGEVLKEDSRPTEARAHDVHFGLKAEDILWATLLKGCTEGASRQWYLARVKWCDTPDRETVLICVGPEHTPVIERYKAKAYHLHQPADPAAPEVRQFELCRLKLLEEETLLHPPVRQLAQMQDEKMAVRGTRSRLPPIPRNLLRELAGLDLLPDAGDHH